MIGAIPIRTFLIETNRANTPGHGPVIAAAGLDPAKRICCPGRRNPTGRSFDYVWMVDLRSGKADREISGTLLLPERRKP